MRWQTRVATVASLALLMVGCALFLTPRAANANPLFQQQTGLPCSGCHEKGRELEGRGGLNLLGQAFLNCKYNIDCARAAMAQPVRHTTEQFVGIAVFKNECSGNASLFVIIREGKNKAKRDTPLILEKGNAVHVVVDRRSTFASKCGDMPSDNGQFSWVPLEKWTE
jgi:hypothetical protein